jgi:ribosomal protein S18 acetylase RimI-like enzyme
LRELQAAELPFNEHLKPPTELGPWYIELLKKQCNEMKGVTLFVEDGNSSLGMAVLFTKMCENGDEEEMAHSYAHISELVVSETAKGRGIGKALFDECERRSKLAGRAELTLAVLAENDPAHHLYLNSGFADVKIKMRRKLT